jgi:hypothetical protein
MMHLVRKGGTKKNSSIGRPAHIVEVGPDLMYALDELHRAGLTDDSDNVRIVVRSLVVDAWARLKAELRAEERRSVGPRSTPNTWQPCWLQKRRSHDMARGKIIDKNHVFPPRNHIQP